MAKKESRNKKPGNKNHETKETKRQNHETTKITRKKTLEPPHTNKHEGNHCLQQNAHWRAQLATLNSNETKYTQTFPCRTRRDMRKPAHTPTIKRTRELSHATDTQWRQWKHAFQEEPQRIICVQLSSGSLNHATHNAKCFVALRCRLHNYSSQDIRYPSWSHQRKWKRLRWWKINGTNMNLECVNDFSPSSPTDTVWWLLLPLNGNVHWTSEEIVCEAEQMNLNQHPLWYPVQGGMSTLIQCYIHPWSPILLTKMADVFLSLAPEVHQTNHWILPIKDWEELENNTCPVPPHSLHLMKLFNASYLRETSEDRRTDTDSDTDTDTETVGGQQDTIRDRWTQTESYTCDTHVGLCGSGFKTVRTRPCMFSETTSVPKLYLTFQEVTSELSFVVRKKPDSAQAGRVRQMNPE